MSRMVSNTQELLGKMRRAVLPVASLALLLASISDSAQAITYSGGATPIGGDIDLRASLSTSLSLDIVGGATPATALSDAAIGSAGINDVDFGSASATCSTVLTTGACAVTTDVSGAHVYGHLVATLTFSGFNNTTLNVYRESPVAGSFASGRVKYATGTATTWTLTSHGTAFGEGIGNKAALATAQPSGTVVNHHVAAWINPTDPAAVYTANLTYEMVGN